MNQSLLIDEYKRRLNYLRVSITDRCNLRCTYCVPHTRIPKLHHKDILRYEEILRIVGVGARLGISKIRITGGEPLIRKGVYDFLQKIRSIEGISDLSLTTNGALLAENLERVRAAGIRRINVSLDTLDREKYQRITGGDMFQRVWQAILQADAMGFAPIKINVVVLRGVNENELEAMAKLTFDFPFHVRFIEHMPIGRCAAADPHPLLTPEIQQRLAGLGPLEEIRRNPNDGPAVRYRLPGARGELGFISALSRHFCRTCNRLRLTASGQLRACLLADQQEDLKTPLRSGCSDEELAAIFFRTARRKAHHHCVPAGGSGGQVSGQMSAIGG